MCASTKRRAKARGWLVALALAAVGPLAIAADAPFAWPKGAKAAVSLAYDDALDSQLDNAIPALNRHRLKASFYLTLAAPSITGRMEAWRQASRDGHELGNHSLFHPCAGSAPGRTWVPAHRDLDSTTAAQMQDQVRLASVFLQAIDGKTERTFTPPCLDLNASNGNYVDALKPDFVGFRARSGAVTEAMDGLDVYAVGADAMVDVSGAQLIALVQQAAAKGTLVSLTFHGVGGDYLSVYKAAHEELLQFLDDNRGTLWTDTFLHVMQYVRSQRRPAPPRQSSQ